MPYKVLGLFIYIISERFFSISDHCGAHSHVADIINDLFSSLCESAHQGLQWLLHRLRTSARSDNFTQPQLSKVAHISSVPSSIFSWFKKLLFLLHSGFKLWVVAYFKLQFFFTLILMNFLVQTLFEKKSLLPNDPLTVEFMFSNVAYRLSI